MEMWELRLKTLALAAQVGEGTGEKAHLTLDRARVYTDFVFNGGWIRRANGECLSTAVLEQWAAPMPSPWVAAS